MGRIIVLPMYSTGSTTEAGSFTDCGFLVCTLIDDRTLLSLLALIIGLQNDLVPVDGAFAG